MSRSLLLISIIQVFACPHCVDEFAFDYQKIAKLNYGWRVRVRCPGCGNVVEVGVAVQSKFVLKNTVRIRRQYA